MEPNSGGQHFSQYVLGNPRLPAQNRFGLAVKKHANGDLEGAIAGYLAAIEAYDKDPAIHWYLGTAYEAVGKTTEAQQEFQKERTMLNSEPPQIQKLPARLGGYGNGSERGYRGYRKGDFGSDRLKFVPGEGMTKLRY